MADSSSHSTEANCEVVRRAFEQWRQQTAPITDLFSSDIVWRIEGSSVASGEYSGKQEFVQKVLAPFAARFSPSDRLRPHVRSTLADGDTVVVVWERRGTALDGLPYANTYVWIMKMVDGQVTGGTTFYDDAVFDDFWNRNAPRSRRASARMVRTIRQ